MSLDELKAAVDAAGEQVRTLKADKAGKEEIVAMVAQLNTAKAAFTDAGGVLPQTAQQQKKKKGSGAPPALSRRTRFLPIARAAKPAAPKKQAKKEAAKPAVPQAAPAPSMSAEQYFAKHDISGILSDLVQKLAKECKTDLPVDPSKWLGEQLVGAMNSTAPCEHTICENGHPKWFNPAATAEKAPQLCVFNSLTDSKRPFVPKYGNTVKWYTCGPTVYDLCHLGHARAYLTFDIIRRIMEDYFHYDVQYIMNITDIDDKIILRVFSLQRTAHSTLTFCVAQARQNHLMAKYTATLPAFNVVKADVEEAMRNHRKKLQDKLTELKDEIEVLKAEIKAEGGNTQKDKELSGKEEKLGEQELKVKQGEDMQAAVVAATATQNVEEMVKVARDALMALMDKRHGAEVTDNTIFRAHCAKMEAEFMKDMDDLGVRRPDVLTRVTEYVPQIEEFIAKIIENGFAYESNSSVYFNTRAYKSAGRDYPKLRPGGSSDLLAEGEGSIGVEGSEKQNETDFALWKKSKKGEPSWKSRWGMGRPGWHIECSVMAGDILGDHMDIHAGGDDLKFPHHDNEVAQSEACWGCDQWVNYFLHAGRLNIDGLKMSKSLKNFTTIQAVLQEFSARQMRIMFLRQAWEQTMMYTMDAMNVAKELEKKYKTFFGNALAAEREIGVEGPQDWTDVDKKYSDILVQQRAAVHESLCDNFNTPRAMFALDVIVKEFNIYMDSYAAPRALLIRKAADYVSRILRVLGVMEDTDYLGFGVEGPEEQTARPFLDAVSKLRDGVRAAAQKKQPVAQVIAGAVVVPAELHTAAAAPFAAAYDAFKAVVSSTDDHSQLLQECDKLRDEVLPPLGVALADRDSGTARWRLDDPATIEASIQAAREQKAAKAAGKTTVDPKKLASRVTQARNELQKFDGMIPIVDFFKTGKYQGLYKEFADDGYPTMTAAGEAVTEKDKKKLVKPYKVHAKNLEGLEKKGGAAYLDSLKKEIAEKEAALAEFEASAGENAF